MATGNNAFWTPRRLFCLKAAVIVLAGWWIFSPAFHGGWLWDDNTDITENPMMRDPAGLWKIWFAPQSLDYYPLKISLQWIQWRLWGMDPFGYHLTNVAVHLLCGFLLWRLLRQLGVRLAWLGGLLFVVHPVAVESVAWVVEFKNPLSLAFLLGSMIAWVNWDERKTSSLHYWLSVLLFLAAMLSKSSVAMFPFVLLLHAWWKRGRIAGKDLRAASAFFAISFVLGVATIWLQQHRTIGSVVIPMGGASSRVAVAGLAIGFYFFKCLWPAELMPIYPRWNVDPPALIQFLPWVGMIALLVWLMKRKSPAARNAIFGLGFFVLNLAPVLGFITVSFMRLTWVMDHLAYVSLAGFAGMAAAVLGAADAAAPRAKVRGAAVFLRLAIAGVLGILAWQSRAYARAFASPTALWTYELEHNPRAWAAHYNLGLAQVEAGQFSEGIGHFEEALRLKPDYLEAENNLANALCQTGRPAEAIPHFERALQLNPGDAVIHYDYGLALRELGRPDEAREQWTEALRLAKAAAARR